MEDRLHAHTTDSRLSSFIFESAIETWGYGKIIRIHQKPTSSENTSCALTDDEGPSPFKFDLVIQSLSISLVDQCPQELLLLTLDDLGVEVNTGIGTLINWYLHSSILLFSCCWVFSPPWSQNPHPCESVHIRSISVWVELWNP